MSAYRPQSEDTSEAIDRQVFDALHRMTPAQRLRLAVDACRAVERLSIAGLRSRFPDASEEELRLRAGMLRIGRELSQRVFGPDATAWMG